MTTSKKNRKTKAKSGAKPAQRRTKAVAAKRSGRKPSSAKTAQEITTTSPALHPRQREQALGSQRSSFPDDFHALYDRGFRTSRGVAPVSESRARAGSRRLASDVEGVEVQYDDATQLPNLVVTTRPAARLSSRAVDSSPEGAVTQFITERRDLWNLSAKDAETIEVVSLSQPRLELGAETPARRTTRGSRAARTTDEVGSLSTVNMVQRVEGKEVFNSDVTAAVNADNQVLCVAGQFFSGAGSATASSRAGTATEEARPASVEEIIARAAFDLTNFPYESSEFVRATDPTDSGPYRFYDYQPKDDSARPTFTRQIRLKDVVFPLSAGQFTDACYLEMWIKGFPAYSYVMDAVDTPELLYRKNLTAHLAFKYRVHNTGDAIFRPEDGPAPGTPHPKGIPNGFQAKTIPEKLISVESLRPGDPWLPQTATTTDGNNCIAYADLNAPDGFSNGDVIGKVSSAGTFDYKYDHSKSAHDANNLQASLVGMFFHVNWLHDRWYEAGFDEASGNAQKNNFGRGGIGGDPILAEGNDFSGTDNANMHTPADGSSPIMQMFEFVGPAPKPSRTSNHEALITFHEMGHFITNRLVGNANGLTNPQGKAMGEGWGDFFAICMTSQATDNFATGTFAAGGWTDVTPNFNENYYFSIRRYPYSADLKKNPLTFKHIGNNVVLPIGPPINSSPFGNNEVHNAGEVWCSILWEVFVNLVAKHGHATAEKRMLAYVVGGLKLTPIRPTFTQARDGILSAVSAIDAADLPVVKEGFAKRGIGQGAVSPPSNSTSLAGVVESFVP